VDFAKLIDEVTKDWEWLSFLARYCAGKNIGKAFCEDIRWWALGVAALVVIAAVWWLLSRLARAYENWNHRRLSARIADANTMKEHVWSGHDAHAPPPAERFRRKK
jgi:ABC-type nickel/cobalt efflux system permease component RcnA